MGTLRIGTCSWKYPSWEGLVYSRATGIDYLAEYARRYTTVEVDQWFWSLFGGKVRLPAEKEVRAYAEAVPDSFRFTVKLPNALSLTHDYAKGRTGPLVANGHFLSPELLGAFLAAVEPLIPHVGLFFLQFEYLNKQKMLGLPAIMEQLMRFLEAWPSHLPLGVEIRNPRWIGAPWLRVLKEHGVAPVLLEGYYMDPLEQTLMAHRELLTGPLCIRLHGRERQEMEKLTGKKWGAIVRPLDPVIRGIVPFLSWRQCLEPDLYVNVNNHFEGCAPLTIEKLKEELIRYDGQSAPN